VGLASQSTLGLYQMSQGDLVVVLLPYSSYQSLCYEDSLQFRLKISEHSCLNNIESYCLSCQVSRFWPPKILKDTLLLISFFRIGNLNRNFVPTILVGSTTIVRHEIHRRLGFLPRDRCHSFGNEYTRTDGFAT